MLQIDFTRCAGWPVSRASRRCLASLWLRVMYVSPKATRLHMDLHIKVRLTGCHHLLKGEDDFLCLVGTKSVTKDNLRSKWIKSDIIQMMMYKVGSQL